MGPEQESLCSTDATNSPLSPLTRDPRQPCRPGAQRHLERIGHGRFIHDVKIKAEVNDGLRNLWDGCR